MRKNFPFKQARTFVRNVIGAKYQGMKYKFKSIEYEDSGYEENTIVIHAYLMCPELNKGTVGFYNHIIIEVEDEYFNAYKNIGFKRCDYSVEKLTPSYITVKETPYLDRI